MENKSEDPTESKKATTTGGVIQFIDLEESERLRRIEASIDTKNRLISKSIKSLRDLKRKIECLRSDRDELIKHRRISQEKISKFSRVFHLSDKDRVETWLKRHLLCHCDQKSKGIKCTKSECEKRCAEQIAHIQDLCIEIISPDELATYQGQDYHIRYKYKDERWAADIDGQEVSYSITCISPREPYNAMGNVLLSRQPGAILAHILCEIIDVNDQDNPRCACIVDYGIDDK